MAPIRTQTSPKKLTFPGVWRIKFNLDDMDYRYSIWAAGAALLIGSSGALLAPTAEAGDRIDFSAPAIPLDIPQPEVEVREPQKAIIATTGIKLPMPDASYMTMPQQVTVRRSKFRDKSPWDNEVFQDDEQDPRNTDDLFTARPEPNRGTNGAGLGMQRLQDKSDSRRLLLRKEDSGLETGRDDSRFGDRKVAENESGRDGDRLGLNSPKERNDSLLFKAFGRDPAAPARFSAWGFAPSSDETRTLTGVESDEQKSRVGLPMEVARSATLPLGYGSYAPDDRRQAEEQAAAAPGYMRAWEPPAPRSLPSKTYSNPYQINPARVVAPSRPVNLPMPKRPGDPNPF
jgi:hypothetical protein